MNIANIYSKADTNGHEKCCKVDAGGHEKYCNQWSGHCNIMNGATRHDGSCRILLQQSYTYGSMMKMYK